MHYLGRIWFCIALACGAVSAQTVANFVTMPPCRIVDTRDPRYSNGNLGPPFMAAQSTRDFAVLSSSCGVPTNAIAYSLNITVVTHGPVLYVSVWPTGQPQPEVSTLNAPNGGIVANAAVVPAGANGSISLYAHGETDVLIDINGYFTPYVAPVIQQVNLPTILAQSQTGYGSLAVGSGSASAGTFNTAVGASTLTSIATGSNNAAFGTSALNANSSGANNTDIGADALTANTSGSNNTALGYAALFTNGASSGNVAVGAQALHLSGGNYNTAVGFNALSGNQIGANNIALGYNAGSLVTTDSNIEIGNTGASNDARTIRIGDPSTHVAAYIAGIAGTSLSAATPVYINSNGQLGIQPSSQRYKEDIAPLTTESDNLLALRPVRFRYKTASADGSKPLQYGLIAEEVAALYPELVLRDSTGQPEAVQYQLLPALLLKQLQKQQQTIAELQRRLAALEQTSHKTTFGLRTPALLR